MNNDYGNLELHMILLSAMKDIDKICRENGLKYYLHAGTLLGAVNYKGFIPWDDDVDISMFPDDFLKFCRVLENEYSKKYMIETFENTANHFSKLNKLRVRNTIIHYDDGRKEEVFVDISVFHNVPKRRTAQRCQRILLELLDRALAVKSGAIVPVSFISRLVLQPLSNLNKETIGRWLDRIMTKYDEDETEYYALMIHMLPNPYTGLNGYENDFVPKKICDNPQYIEFEDTEFMVYSDPIIDLKRRYGEDYWRPYPEEKRISKHGIIGYEKQSESVSK